MDDIDDLFDSRSPRADWRDRLTGEALDLCQRIEARIEETGKAPSWQKIAARLAELGVTITGSTVGSHYRNKYPQIRHSK